MISYTNARTKMIVMIAVMFAVRSGKRLTNGRTVVQRSVALVKLPELPSTFMPITVIASVITVMRSEFLRMLIKIVIPFVRI